MYLIYLLFDYFLIPEADNRTNHNSILQLTRRKCRSGLFVSNQINNIINMNFKNLRIVLIKNTKAMGIL